MWPIDWTETKDMTSWQEEMLATICAPSLTIDEVFARTGAAARALGFDHVAYGARSRQPGGRLQTGFINDYPTAWQQRYADQNYLSIDPTVAVAQRSHKPVIWSSALFASAQSLWDDAQSFDLRHGWAQSSRNGTSTGLLTLSRSSESITAAFLEAHELNMRWLANVAHLALSNRLTMSSSRDVPSLTPHEAAVIREISNGSTAPEVGDRLGVADSEVAAHLATAMRKLDVGSRTTMSVKAAMLNLAAR